MFVPLLTMQAQDRDKVSADKMLYEQLCASHTPDMKVKPLTISERRLQRTNEDGIWMHQGDSFQIRSLTQDYYVCKENGRYKALFDRKYPVESLVNLLQNHIKNNMRISINHHVYGGTKKVPEMPLQNVYDLLSPNMAYYSSVTSVNKDEMKALLVFHHKRMNFIHMFILTVPMTQLFKQDGVIRAELYGNIPQGNVKSLFGQYHSEDYQMPVKK